MWLAFLYKLVCRYILALSICPSRFSGLTPCMCLSSIFSLFTSSNSFNHKNQSNNHYVTYCYEIILHFIKEINIFISISNISFILNWSKFYVCSNRCMTIFMSLNSNLSIYEYEYDNQRIRIIFCDEHSTLK